MAATKKCVFCDLPPTYYGGHVHIGNQTIIAGQCKSHQNQSLGQNGCKGCYGQWEERMGINNDFGGVFAIESGEPFPDFWYESNQCWGWVESFEGLAEKADLQIRGGGVIRGIDGFLDGSCQNPDAISRLDFGTRREHSSEYTLRQFLNDKGILDAFLSFYAQRK